MAKSKDPEKSFLVHSKKMGAGEPTAENEEGAEARAGAAVRPPDAALSEKMAKISSIRESGIPAENPGSFSEKQKAVSSLPGAMARVHQKLQEDRIRERLSGKSSEAKSLVKRPQVSDDLNVGDPQPGAGKSFLWFVFAYGRYAQGVLLGQSLQVTFLFLMVCGLGSIQFSMVWLAPAGGPGPMYNGLFTSRVLAGGMVLGMGSYLLASLLIYLVLMKKSGGIGKFYGLKVLVNAFLPLAVGQLLILAYATLTIGESFWRGQVPEGYGFCSSYILPALWIWGGYRIAQAISGLFSLPFISRLWLKTGITLGMAVPVILVASGLTSSMKGRADREWAQLKLDLMAATEPLPVERFDGVENRLAFRDVERKQDLYLLRMQNLYRQDLLDAARADALRLDRLALTGSAEDELAKGLNYLFRDRLDLAIPRFEAAISQNPECFPAHQWLSLGLLGTDIAKSEAHARILMQYDPNVFHLQLLVRILFAQEKYQDIWDAMLMVDAAPEAWDPVTLYQGGGSAERLEHPRRAELLFTIARSKGLETEEE
ncbi:hypothetical protein P0Y35_05665 [Kiritimatiellaeota bacterium B1221]|nr:hypothetical protein [Kiritimatiellaeota bacterium B1221]